MTKTERAKALIKHLRQVETPALLASYEAMSEDTLKALEGAQVADAAASSTTAQPTAAQAQPLTEAALLEASPTLKQLVGVLPAIAQIAQAMPSLLAMSAQQQSTEAARREVLVGQLKTAQSAYTEEELKALPMPQLEKLAQVAKVGAPAGAVDYSLLGQPRAAGANEKIEAPTGLVSHIRAANAKAADGKTTH